MFAVRKKKAGGGQARIRRTTSDEEEVAAVKKSDANPVSRPGVKMLGSVGVGIEVDGEDTEDASLTALLERKKAKAKAKDRKMLSLLAKGGKDGGGANTTPAEGGDREHEREYSRESLRALAASQRSFNASAVAAMDYSIDDDDDTMHIDTVSTRILTQDEIYAKKKLREDRRKRPPQVHDEDDFVALDGTDSVCLLLGSLSLDRNGNRGGTGVGRGAVRKGGPQKKGSLKFPSASLTPWYLLPHNQQPKPKPKSQKESRLVTEDQEEGDDEPEAFDAHTGARIHFGNKTADQLRQDRRKAIERVLVDMDKPASDAEDQEDLWHQDQLRKAASAFTRPYRPRAAAAPANTPLYDPLATPAAAPPPAPAAVLTSLEAALDALTLESTHTAQSLTREREHLLRLSTQREETQAGVARAKKRYEWYQRLLVQWGSFADLLDAKMPLFDALVGELVGAAAGLREAAAGVRAEAVRGVAEAAATGGGVDSFGREVKRDVGVGVIENLEDVEVYLGKEVEVGSVDVRAYREAIDEITENRTLLLSDVSDEYKDMRLILAAFSSWKQEYSSDFSRSYACLTVHQALAPFVKIQICDWNPFAEGAVALQDTEWHDLISQVTEFDDTTDSEDADPLISMVVKKAVIPHVKRLLPAALDLNSRAGVQRALRLFFTLEEYSGRKSAAFKGLVDALIAHAESTVNAIMADHPTEMMQLGSTASAAGPISGQARDTVFWHVFKLWSNLLVLKSVFPGDKLQALVVDALVNKYLTVYLGGPAARAEDILKYELLFNAIPAEWVKASPQLLVPLQRHIKWFAVHVVGKERRDVLDRVAVLLL
ncbi:hypothetical protein BC830DRAFT_313231 [Chytriomyces sp. MP71]|nr:hypothetical protein BC830DRAFT_313231 [Chytriomyces sp. MP71]